jgi:IS1 family transposase
MNRLSTEKRAQILGMLCEGMSMRATARLSGASYMTVIKLLVDAGETAQDFHDRTVSGLSCKRLQLDEIWAFCYAKQGHLQPKHEGLGYGDIWTWTALDADTKLLVSWLVGTRKSQDAHGFLVDLRSRVVGRPQITTDGHKLYLDAVSFAFGQDVDYAQQIKVYGADADTQRRYSPPECIGTKEYPLIGKPDPYHISTSYVERQNLNIRMHNRRFTRLTNAFSKKAANHAHSFALYALHHNFARIHKTLRVTPAMEAGLSDHPWTLEEMAGLLDTSNQRHAA